MTEFEVRRIPINYPKPAGAAGSSSSSSTTTPASGTNHDSGKKQSAEADHRKLAVIAAAEAREKASKAKLKPMKQVTKTTLARQQLQQQQLQQSNADTISLEPMTEEAKRARAAAKLGEAQLAQQLGYNPYETARATAGQARTATVAVQHGTIQVATTNESSTPIPGVVASPPNALVVADEDDVQGVVSLEPPSEVQEALATLFSSWSHETATLASTCTIMKTLIVNATTKGQLSSSSSTTGVGEEEDASASKFRKVRLANPKIKAALVDVTGAIDVMMAVGFALYEEDGESFLIFPKGTPGGPLWLPVVLKELESAVP